MRKLTITLLVVALSVIGITAVAVAASSAAPKTSTVLYSDLVQPFTASNPPHEWWSLSFGGTNAVEYGDKVNLESSAALSSASVILDSQACQTGSGATCSTSAGATFAVPITFTIYQPGSTGGSVGAVLASQTKTFKVPYRPSANPTACGPTSSSIFSGASNDGTQWLSAATGSCYYGITYAATFSDFSFTGSKVLPTTVVYGVSYNASSGPASSLNVLQGAEGQSGRVFVGSDTDPGNLFVEAGSGSNDLGGSTGEITCSTVGTTFEEYNTAVGSGGCGTDTQEGSGAPYEPIAFVPAVQLNGS